MKRNKRKKNIEMLWKRENNKGRKGKNIELKILNYYRRENEKEEKERILKCYARENEDKERKSKKK